MPATLVKATILASLVAACAAVCIRRLRRTRSPGMAACVAGCDFLLVVALTHVAEALHALPEMGWGQRATAGHYVDLISAAMGGTLLVGGALVEWRAHHRA